MTADNSMGAFLRARRELVRPEDVGLPAGARRRVPGLRREELAMLAGVSSDYYVRLEQGRERHPSEHVLDSIARVLQLDETATAYLLDLARSPAVRRRRGRTPERIRPELVRLLDGWSGTPAMVFGRCMDVLAANALGLALYGRPLRGENVMRMMFLDPGSRSFYPEWDKVARETVAALRSMAGDPDDPQLVELVGELSLKSEDFRRLWARHDVHEKAHGHKRFEHPIVGGIRLAYDSFAVGGAAGQMLVVYHAEPGSADAQALELLSTVAADLAGASATATLTSRVDHGVDGSD